MFLLSSIIIHQKMMEKKLIIKKPPTRTTRAVVSRFLNSLMIDLVDEEAYLELRMILAMVLLS